MMIFEAVNLLFMSHWVSGKYAVGVPHASVLIELELPLRTSDGTLGAFRGQNQTLMNVGVRSIAYLHTGGKNESSSRSDLQEEVNEGLAGFTHHPPPLLLNAGP